LKKTKGMEGEAMNGYTKQVEIVKTVPVSDLETLTVWLDQELNKWLDGDGQLRDGGQRRATVGSKALALVREAGFELKLPVAARDSCKQR